MHVIIFGFVVHYFVLKYWKLMNCNGMNGAWDMINGSNWGRIWFASLLLIFNTFLFCSVCQLHLAQICVSFLPLFDRQKWKSFERMTLFFSPTTFGSSSWGPSRIFCTQNLSSSFWHEKTLSESFYTWIKNMVNVSYSRFCISLSPLCQYHLLVLLTDVVLLTSCEDLMNCKSHY